MTTPLTADQAISLLRKNPQAYRTPENLRALAAQVDADSPGRTTVVYSGSTANGVGSSDVIKAMQVAGEDVRVIDNSQAAKFMTSNDFYNSAAKAYDLPDFRSLADGTYRGPATDWLYHPTQGPWADASARFADATVGEVRAIVSDAAPNRVFGAKELPRLLANPKVTTIEGIPREVLAARQASHGTQAAFEMTLVRAHERVGQLQVAVNYAGTPLRGDSGQLMLDSRGYFVGTEIDSKTPTFTTITRPLADSQHPPSAHVLAGQQHWQDWQAQVRQAESTRSPHSNLARGAGILGAAATAYDATTTAARAAELREQGNPVGAQSEVMQFGARNVGGWGGALLGAGAGAAVTSSTGPGALIGSVVGGIAGAVGGDKFAAYLDQQRINTQTDRNGQVWHFDPRQEHAGWIRTVRELDVQAMTASTVDMPIYTPERRLAADPATAAELSYKASSMAVQLALADPPRLVNPYRIAADASDTPRSMRDSHWTRHPETGQWSRPVADGLIDRTMHTYIQPATPEKAAELDAYAQSVMAHNAERSPVAIAQRYEQTYIRLGWAQFGPVPEAVTHARTPAQEPTQTRTADPAPSEVRAQPPQVAAPDPGDQARSIATLQSGLIQLGYHRAISQPLAVNGVNDDATRQAVTAFQAKHDLPITSTFDAATQQALQQALLAQQQQVAEQRQTQDKTREQERAEKEQNTKEQARSEELLPYSDPSSPLHAHRADLAQRAQAAGASLTEEQLTLGVAQMQAHHIKPGWEGGVTVHDGILYVSQYMPPEHFRLDTRQPAPPVQETLQQAVTQQREHAEEIARMEAMPKIHGPTLGPGGPGGMPSLQG